VRKPLAALVLLTCATAASAAGRAPLLLVATPPDISELAPIVEVNGTVSDPAGSLAWSMPGTGLGGDVPLAADGSFSFHIAAEDLHLSQSVRIVARDSVGRSEERVLLLVDPDPGPLLELDEPAPGPSAEGRFVISGRVADASGGQSAGWLHSLIWSLPPTGRGGTIEVDEDGRFSADIDGAGAEGGVLWLRAEDRYGHLTLRPLGLAAAAIALTTEPAPLPAAAEPPVAAVPPAAAEPPAPSAAVQGIEIVSPAGVGWYRTRLTIEGTLADPSVPVESLSWSVSGERGPTGEVLVDSDGTFRIELATGEISGDRTLELAGQTAGGGTVAASLPLRDGRRAPAVRIDAPQNNGAYGARLQLAGSVTDPYAGVVEMEGYESVSWQIAPLGVTSREQVRTGSIEVAADGTFSVALSTRGVNGPQIVSVTAVGRSGNRGEAGVRVIRGESDLPSFSAAAGDGTVTLRWDPQAKGTRCDILYTEDREVGDGGGASTVEGVQPPYEVRGLSNGSRYVFRLRAVTAGEPDSWSSEAVAVPLGRGTLKPTAVGEYGGVRLSWARLPGVESCEVWRSARRDEGWELAAPGRTDAAWFDATAAAGIAWYYRIRPEIPGAISSDPASAAALEFAVRALEPAGASAIAGACAVAVSGAYAWVCRGPGGVQAVDLSDASSPRGVAAVESADARAIAVAGTVACIADGEQGVVVLDISDPRAPRVVGVRYLQDPRSVVMAGDIAFVACGPAGVRLVDVSDPRSPQRRGVVASPDARALSLIADRLLVADAVDGLGVYDLVSPAAPRPIGRLPIAGARSVVASGSRAIVLTTSGLAIVDLGDPARPVLLADVPGAVSAAAVTDDGYAIIAGTSGVSVVDISEPTGAAIDAVPVAAVSCMAIAGDIACVLDAGSLRLLRLRVLGRPSVLGEAVVAGSAGGIALAGGTAFVAARSSGLHVVEVSEQGSRRAVRPAAVFGARFAEDVAASGSIAYVADGAAGLRIVAVEPGDPGTEGRRAREVSAFQPGGVVHAVSVSGRLACIAAGPAGVRVLDVSDPAVPRQLASIPSPDARDVALEGSGLLVAAAPAGLRGFALADPPGPATPSAPPATSTRVSAGKGWALAVGGEGVSLLDWTEAAAPRITGFYRSQWAEDACREGERMLVAEGHRGLTVLDVSDPARPRIVSALRDRYASAVTPGEGCVLVAGTGSVAALKILVPPWLEQRD